MDPTKIAPYFCWKSNCSQKEKPLLDLANILSTKNTESEAVKCLSEWPLKILLDRFKIFESKYSNIFAETYKVKIQIIGLDGVYL